MKTLETTKQRIEAKRNQFAVTANYTEKRSGNYELRDKIQGKWENYKGSIEGCGNCHNLMFFNTNTQSFIFSKEYISYTDENNNVEYFIPLGKIMSPSLLLYRLISTFFGIPKCYDGYKSIWGYDLIHKASGKGINFSEWKGAIGFWLPEYTPAKLTSEFKRDLIELMNYLASNECAHPYDELVAGSVA